MVVRFIPPYNEAIRVSSSKGRKLSLKRRYIPYKDHKLSPKIALDKVFLKKT